MTRGHRLASREAAHSAPSRRARSQAGRRMWGSGYPEKRKDGLGGQGHFSVNTQHFCDGIQSHHFIANRWGNMETVSDFILGGSKITEDGDCSHEIKRHLLLGRKVMTNLDSIFKSRDITLPTKVHLVKALVFPVVMYGCESWTIKKDEC